jgi:hypothetical protein
MGILAVQQELVNPADDYPAFVRDLDKATRLLLFGAAAGATRFRCPTNGRLYDDPAPQVMGDLVWTKCQWCDTFGTLRGEPGYRADRPQPHVSPLIGGDE